MPSQKPRLNLTLDEELNDVITDLSRLMNVPKTRVITDFLKDVYPILCDVRDALQLAEEKKSVIPHLTRLAASANQRTADLNGEMSDLLSKYEHKGVAND